MPSDAYITVTLKKETVKILLEYKEYSSTSKAVTDAINEYVYSRIDSKPMKKTPDVVFVTEPTGTTTPLTV